LKEKWDAIPEDTDILITHGPAYGFVDTVESRPYYNLGCELLTKRINQIQPKIHVCGHIHSGYGVKTNNNTHFINASVLNERYKYTQKPWNVEWDYESNTIEII
jgi:Icc-related predicted phosphoesterase